MFNRFFKQSLDKLKPHQKLIETAAFGVVAAYSIYNYPKDQEKWVKSHITLFYNQLSEKEKEAIKRDPQKEKEFIEDCESRMRLIIGPPD